LGIDGSGKSTVTAALPAVLAAELGARAGSAGEAFLLSDPDEDHLSPKFHPDGLPCSAGLSKRLKRAAKRHVDNRRLYPALKVAQLVSQDHATYKIGRRYKADVMVSDGNVLLSATGRAANYLRPASNADAEAAAGPEPMDLRAVFDCVLDGKPVPKESESRLPPLRRARKVYRILRLLGIRGVWLPDVVVFLDIAPAAALERIAGRGARVDRHENERDLAQARQMYLRTLDAFALYREEGAVHRITLNGMSPGEVLSAVLESLRPRILEQKEASRTDSPLGTTETRLMGGSIWGKVFNGRYLVRYLLAKWFQGAWREPTFAFSRLGRLFLKEGYSAGVMRLIYDRDERDYGLFDRIFLEYPLHRAVYDRLQILTRKIKPELIKRLKAQEQVTVFTAPSGFAYDLFRPLEAIVKRAPEAAARVRVVAADIDPHDALGDELTARAEKLGIRFEFLRGDITDGEMRRRFARAAPYDIALFVGLSSWLPKPQIARHMRWVREHIKDDGVLVTDCFTPDAYALSGRYVGYKAHYYTPDIYRAFMDYCGFDGLSAPVESGRDGINHVMLFAPREPEIDGA
jgi:hypothetical protein